MHACRTFSEGAQADRLDCRTAIYPAPRLCHPPRLPESKPSSSASPLLLLQHARASVAPHRDASRHRTRLEVRCRLLFNTNVWQARIQPGSATAQEPSLTTETTFPGLISKSEAPPQTPSRPGGRAEVTEGCDAAGPAPPSPREIPAGNTPGVQASCAAARGAGPAGADGVPAAATRSPHGDDENDSEERRGRAAFVRGDVTSTRFTAALRALCLPQPVTAGPAFHPDGAGDAHLSPQPGTAPRGWRSGEQGRSPAAGGGQPGTPQRPRGRPPVSRQRTKKAQKR